MSTIKSLLKGAAIAAMSQNQTNGNTKLGTLQAYQPPEFLTNNPMVNGRPWGNKDPWNTDPRRGAPNTGVTRYYDFNIARGIISPDGVNKSILMVNGQFPGPTIEANWGDTIQVTVNNNIQGPEEGTAMHWHGLNQQNSEWMDGVPAVSQCPLAPGKSQVYTFQATPYGTTHYHSHYSAQWVGGLVGPIVIYGPKNVDYDVDLGPIMLTDYFHRDYYDVLEEVMGNDLTKIRPASDNNLINGKMNYNCANTSVPCTDNAGLAKFNFTSGKSHRLRLINAGAQAIEKFSIDGHTMQVMAYDFIPIVPYNTTVVTLSVGQRADVIVYASGKPTDSYWMRSHITTGQCTEPSTQQEGLAIIYYEKSNTTSVPNTTAQVDNSDPCANDALSTTVPQYSMDVGTPATTEFIDASFAINSTGHLVWLLNNQTFLGNYDNPLLLLAKAGNVSYPFDPQWNVHNYGTNASVRIILNNTTPTSHPWHVHGHEMSILYDGPGPWDGVTLNTKNPMRRDVHILRAHGAMVLQWDQDNPGVWPFHCHIAWHVSGGLYMNILENPPALEKLPIPSTNYQVCRDWVAYSGSSVRPQIDSGL